MPRTLRLLLLVCGEANVRQLLARYWAGEAPQQFKLLEAKGFSSFLRQQELPVQFLPEVLAFEEAVLKAVLANESMTVSFPYDPGTVLDALAQGRLPRGDPPEPSQFELEITP
jgi:hypothetical protein